MLQSRRPPGRSLQRSGHHGVSCTRTVAASRVEGQRTAVMSFDGLEGVADVGPYEAQWQVRWHPVPALSTAQGWRPTGLAPPPNPARSQESKSRVRPAPLRGLGASAVPEQAARHHGTGTGHAAQFLPQWRGWAPSWGVGAAAPGREPQAHDGAAPPLSGH
jgi:hypothetical protein